MIKRCFFSALCLAVCLGLSIVPAWAVSQNDVVRALEDPFKAGTDRELRIYDYSADFFQESKIASLDRLQRASGRVEVAFDYRTEQTVPEVKFRWRYNQPTTQEIVSDGKTMWVFLPENNQVIQSEIEMVNRARQNDPMTFLTGLGNLSRDFFISWAIPNQDIDGNYILELTPRRSSALINKLIIVVDQYAVEAHIKRNQNEDSISKPTLDPPLLPRGEFAFPGYEGGPNDVWFPIMSTAVYDPNGNSTIIEFSNLRINLGIPDMSFDFIIPAGVQVVRPTGKEMGF